MKNWVVFVLVIVLPFAFTSAQEGEASPEDCESRLNQASDFLSQAQAALSIADAATANDFISAAQVLVAPCAGEAVPSSVGTNLEVVVTSNAEWTPILETFGGVEMVLVPSGCFLMGNTVENVEAIITQTGDDIFLNQTPQHEVCIENAFWIDRYEVTNAQFETLGGEASARSNWQGEQRPRENVTWVEARDYCELRGMRLPTEAEWEYAARGPDNLRFAWGDEFVSANVVWGGNANGETASVGSREGGASWVGAFDMTGNVWEWMSSIYDQTAFPYPYDATDGRENLNDSESQRVLRGSSWDFALEDIFQVSYRLPNDTDYRFINIGIRCVLAL